MTTNTTATFAPETLTMNGQTFPAGYSVTPAGTVFVFVTVQENGEPVNLRIKIDEADPNHPAALAAARSTIAQEPEQEPEQPAEAVAQEPEQEPEQPAEAITQEPEQEPEQPAEAITQEPEQPARDPKQARGPVPEKAFIGLEIKGNGWKIAFDGSYDRTRVIFKRKPGKAAEEAVKKAGFYWSPVLGSWNKKLTHKAFRAAQALALELRTICG